MIKFYHNPRCSKSREGLKYLEDKGLHFETVKYMTEGITTGELKSMIERLGYASPKELVRTNEKIWKENYADQKLTDDALIEIMVEHPRLIQRPIIINGERAVVGRPTEKIDEVL